MRIGILTFHRALNSGAMLQAWALKRTLEKMGHAAEFPVCNHVGDDPRWVAHASPSRKGLMRVGAMGAAFLKNVLSVPVEDVARVRYRRFRETHLPERECGVDELGSLYDALVVGSDQVWNEWHTKDSLPLFLGENWPSDARGIVYAASCGETKPSDEYLARLRAATRRFAGVSVREGFTKDDLERSGAKGVEVVADPTLLLPADEYLPLAEGVPVPKEPYLFAYNVFFKTRDVARTARALAARLGVRAVVVSVYQYTLYGAPWGLTFGVSPDRMLAYAAGARYVLAGSLHGTILGVLFGKPTLSLGDGKDAGRSRREELLNSLGLGDRYMPLSAPLDQMERILRMEAVAPETRERLEALRSHSTDWLARQLRQLETGKGGAGPGERP